MGRRVPSRLSDASDPGDLASRAPPGPGQHTVQFAGVVPGDGARARDGVAEVLLGVGERESLGGGSTFSNPPSMSGSRAAEVVGSPSALPPSQRTGHGGGVLCAALDQPRGLLVTGGSDCRVKCFAVQVRGGRVCVSVRAGGGGGLEMRLVPRCVHGRVFHRPRHACGGGGAWSLPH
jgi:hypothetical protein